MKKIAFLANRQAQKAVVPRPAGKTSTSGSGKWQGNGKQGQASFEAIKDGSTASIASTKTEDSFGLLSFIPTLTYLGTEHASGFSGLAQAKQNLVAWQQKRGAKKDVSPQIKKYHAHTASLSFCLKAAEQGCKNFFEETLFDLHHEASQTTHIDSKKLATSSIKAQDLHAFWQEQQATHTALKNKLEPTYLQLWPQTAQTIDVVASGRQPALATRPRVHFELPSSRLFMGAHASASRDSKNLPLLPGLHFTEFLT